MCLLKICKIFKKFVTNILIYTHKWNRYFFCFDLVYSSQFCNTSKQSAHPEGEDHADIEICFYFLRDDIACIM